MLKITKLGRDGFTELHSYMQQALTTASCEIHTYSIKRCYPCLLVLKSNWRNERDSERGHNLNKNYYVSVDRNNKITGLTRMQPSINQIWASPKKTKAYLKFLEMYSDGLTLRRSPKVHTLYNFLALNKSRTSDLLLTNRAKQKWWDVTPVIIFLY